MSEETGEAEEISGEIVKAPTLAGIRYRARHEDGDDEPGKVARVLVRVDYADGRIREYEALEPEGFEMNDPETDLSFGSMRMSVQSGGSPFMPMMAAVWSLRLKFRANPRRMAEIRTERTARPREDRHRRGLGD
jgi:hypothetical protein